MSYVWNHAKHTDENKFERKQDFKAIVIEYCYYRYFFFPSIVIHSTMWVHYFHKIKLFLRVVMYQKYIFFFLLGKAMTLICIIFSLLVANFLNIKDYYHR